MEIKSVEEFCICRSMKDGERCRFFRGMPPLKPGFKPNPADPAFLPRGANEEIYPDREAPGMGTGAHYVYLVTGEGVPAGESAVFATVSGVAMCWLVQSGQVYVGVDAIKRAFGDLVDTSAMHDPGPAIDLIREALLRMSNAFPSVRFVFAVDTGAGLLPEGNDHDLVNTILALEQTRTKATLVN